CGSTCNAHVEPHFLPLCQAIDARADEAALSTAVVAAVLSITGGIRGSRTDRPTLVPCPYVHALAWQELASPTILPRWARGPWRWAASCSPRGGVSPGAPGLAHTGLCHDILCRSRHRGEHEQWHLSRVPVAESPGDTHHQR